jgi:hypothetical protein
MRSVLMLLAVAAVAVPPRAQGAPPTPAEAWAAHELGLDGSVPPPPDDLPPVGYVPPAWTQPPPITTSPAPPTWLRFGIPGYRW